MNREILNEGLMRELAGSFADEEWVEDEKRNLMLAGEGGTLWFVDHGKNEVEWDKELILYRSEEGAYILQECILDGRAEYYFRMPNYESPPSEEEGVLGPVYGPDGTMSVNANLNNLPLKIDMEKTIELFIKQAINKDFSKPILVET